MVNSPPSRAAWPVEAGYSGPPRGLFANIGMALTQPAGFFRTLPAGRQWLVVALLVLLLIGLTTVRRPASTGDAAPAPADILPPGDFGGLPPGAVPGDFGAPPLPPDAGGAPPAAGASNVQQTLTTGLLAAAGVVIAWMVQAVFLAEVSLFNGRAPRLGRNFQIAVWSSLPLAMMALLQLVFYAIGGLPVERGLTSLLTYWPAFANFSPEVQVLVASLAMQLTLFWLWSLLLLYHGARGALRGRWWASALAVLAWAVVAVFVPVVTGTVTAPRPDTGVTTEAPPDIAVPDAAGPLPQDGQMPPPVESVEPGPAVVPLAP